MVMVCIRVFISINRHLYPQGNIGNCLVLILTSLRMAITAYTHHWQERKGNVLVKALSADSFKYTIFGLELRVY